MKRLSRVIFCVLFSSVIFSHAYAEERVTRDQVDTLVARVCRTTTSVQTIYRWAICGPKSKGDDVIREYLYFRGLSDAMYDQMKELPASEIKNQILFSGSYVYFRLMSGEFWHTFRKYIVAAENDKKFDYTIRDSDFAKLAESVDEDFPALMKRALKESSAPMRPSAIYQPKVLKISQDKLPFLLVKTLMEYFSYEEFIASHPECLEVCEKIGQAGIEHMGVLLENDFINEVRDSFLNDRSSLDRLAEYMTVSRGPLYVERGKYRPEVSGLKLKEGVYSGQTYDGLPDGYGKLIDKKGVLYTGDFRNGLRHGLVWVYKKPEMLEVEGGRLGTDASQLWFRGKFYKDASFGPYPDGIMPEVPLVEGERFGYGCLYNIYTSELKKGFFIDGKLVSKGTRYKFMRGFKESGVYHDNLITDCVIEWEDKALRRSDFHGIQNGDFRSGTRRKESLERNEQWIYKGEFIDDKLEGKGDYLYIKDKDTTTRTGYFAYGKMYGPGNIVTRRQADKEGKIEIRSYEGMVYRNVPYGNGSAEICFTSVPDNKLVATRYGVKLNEYLSGTTSVTIKVDGYFVNGKLTEGKITMSNGTYMCGKFTDGVLSEGRLIKRYADGSSYDGECVNGRYHGYGKVIYADGSTYEGLFENGTEKSCRGVLVRQDSERKDKSTKTYSFSDLPVEKGVVRVVRAAGVKILVRGMSSVEVTCFGSFNGDIMSEGRVWVSDGTWLDGSFEYGVLIKGKGKTIDKYGTVYTGDIRNGFPHGEGVCRYKDGTLFKGNFANGNRMDGVHYAADGKVIKVYEK